MSTTVFILLIIAMALTVGVLLLGVFSMARGGEFNRKYGNTFMRYRVAFQALAVALFVILMLMLAR